MHTLLFEDIETKARRAVTGWAIGWPWKPLSPGSGPCTASPSDGLGAGFWGPLHDMIFRTICAACKEKLAVAMDKFLNLNASDRFRAAAARMPAPADLTVS